MTTDYLTFNCELSRHIPEPIDGHASIVLAVAASFQNVAIVSSRDESARCRDHITPIL